MGEAKKVFVVDANALIKGVRLERLGGEIWTVPEVLSEVRDKFSRDRLTVVPYEIRTREPTPESLAAVVSFAHKTGDYSVLSKNDLRLLALTYTFEKEVNGLGNIRSDPVPQKLIQATQQEERQVDSDADSITPANDSAPPEPSASAAADQQDPHSETSTSASASASALQVDPFATTVPVPRPFSAEAGSFEESCSRQPDASASPPCNQPVQPPSADQHPRPQQNADGAVEEPQQGSQEEAEAEEDEDEGGRGGSEEDDGDGEWITPENIRGTFGSSNPWLPGGAGSVCVPDQHINVACVSSDFALQNVVLQMGMKLISFDGLQIRSIKTFVLRCHACFLTTREMSRLFCSRCGHHTLVRVATRVDDDGNIWYYNSRKPLNTRGTKYSIPLPKGGRKNEDIVLTEDTMPDYRRAMLRASRRKPKLEQDLLTAWDDKFAGGLGARKATARPAVVGYGKRNPNEGRRRGSRK